MITILAAIVCSLIFGFAGYFFREHLYKKNPPKVIINADLITGNGGKPIFECYGEYVQVEITSNRVEYNIPPNTN